MIAVHLPAGIDTRPEFYMRFALWAQSVEKVITWELIADHFDVSRATAYRWLSAWKNASGRP